MNMKKMEIVYISIIVVLLIVIVLLLSQNLKSYPTEFDVKYYGTYSSGAGDRILNITYHVKDGEITSCDGYYSSPAPVERLGEQDVEECSVHKLVWGYNVPKFLVIELGSDVQLEGEKRDGPSYYSWKISFD